MTLLKFIFSVMLVIPSVACLSQQLSIHVEGEQKIPLRDTSVVYVEPHLSVHPFNPAHFIVTAAVVNPVTDSVLSPICLTTTDGGKRFSFYQSAIGNSVDVWSSFGLNGVAHFAQLLSKGGYIYMHKSLDGGLKWGEPAAPFGRRHDHETLVTDFSNGAYHGETYLVSVRDATDGARNYGDIYLARTNDQGTSFTYFNTFRFSNLNLNTYTPVITRAGDLIIPFGTFARQGLGGVERLSANLSWIIRSSDGGKSFSPPSFIGIGGDFSFPVLAIDTSARFPDRLYYVTTQTDSGAILLFYSPDKGDSWSKPQNIHKLAYPRPRASGVPQLAVNNAGILAMAWMEKASEKENCQNVFVMASNDGGKSFTTPVRVSKAVSCAVENRNGWAAKRWSAGGDYFGFAAKADGSFHLVWSDNRSGKFELYQAQVSTSEK